MERKMHWVNWDKLCMPKAQGGMGFRDIKVFNQAFLARQGWRLLCDTESLAAQVLKMKYYKNITFLDALRGYDPSYVWRSIWGAKALLLEGLKWRAGDGRDILVQSDAWLPADSANIVPTPNLECRVDLRVAYLIDPGRMVWNEQALATHLTEDDVMLVRKLPLSERRSKDLLYWWSAKDGCFILNRATGWGGQDILEGGMSGLVGMVVMCGDQFGTWEDHRSFTTFFGGHVMDLW